MASVLTQPSWARNCREAWKNAVRRDGGDIDAHFDLLGCYSQAAGVAGRGRDKAASALTAIDALHAS